MAAHACWLLTRDHARLNQVYGPPTLDEEIAAETGGVTLGAGAGREGTR